MIVVCSLSWGLAAWGGVEVMRLSNAPTPKKHCFCQSVPTTFSPHVLLITGIFRRRRVWSICAMTMTRKNVSTLCHRMSTIKLSRAGP